MAVTIEEIDRQAQNRPYHQPDPGGVGKAHHHQSATDDAGGRHEPNPGGAKLAAHMRGGDSQHHDAGTDHYEGEQRPDGDQIGQDVERENGG